MNFQLIKDFIKEHKKYCFIGVLLIIGIFYYCTNQKSEVDNTSLLTQTSQSSAKVESETEKTSSSSSSLPNVTNSTASTKVTCDISGAVKHGGVYTLKNGARLLDLIEAAGGLTEKAQVKAINRAQLLKDQDQIYIPHEGEKIEPRGDTTVNSGASSDSTDASKEQIHLNSATVSDLQKLNGVGQKRAEQIIQFRDANGGFKQIEDITKVSGIGEKTFEKFKDQLAL